MNVDDLNAGIYLVKVHTNSSEQLFKLIKK